MERIDEVMWERVLLPNQLWGRLSLLVQSEVIQGSHKEIYASLNILACDGSVKIFYFFLLQFWKVILFQEFVHFFQVVHFISIELLVVISYNPLYFSVVCCDLSIFISGFVDLVLLPLFLDESGLRFVNFIYLFKKPAFSFVDFFCGLWFLLHLFLP